MASVAGRIHRLPPGLPTPGGVRRRTRFRSALVLLLAVAATTLAVVVPGVVQAATGATWGYVLDDNPLATTGNTGVVQVTEAGGNGTCQTSGRRSSSGNVLVGVLCFAPGGAVADEMFYATYAVGAGTRAFAYAQDTRATTSGALPSTSSFDGLGGSLTSTRHAVGSYTVTIPHLAGGNGTVKLTPIGSAQTMCTIDRWGAGTVDLHCADAAGNPVDSAFGITFANRLSLLGVARTGGYALNSSLDQTYTDTDPRAFNSSRGAVVVSHVGTGTYQVQFTGFGSSSGGHSQATAYGATTGVRCEIGSAFAESSTVEDVYVDCADSGNNPVDSLFTMQFVI